MKAISARVSEAHLHRLIQHERGVIFGPVAFMVGVVGEVALLWAGAELLGSLLFLLAAILAAYAWSSIQTGSLTQVCNKSLIQWQRQSVVRLVCLGASLLLAIGSMVAWSRDPGAIFGLQGILWLAGICLLVVSCVSWPPVQAASNEPKWSRSEAFTLLGILSLACFTYLFALDDIPWRFHYDEAIAYEEAMRFYRGPQIPLFGTTWHETSLPTLWFAIAGALMHIGGTVLGGVRLGVALVGVATVLPVYGLGKLMLGRAGGTIAALAVATVPVAIHYSRVSIINSTTAFAWAVCFYFLLKGLSSGRPADFAWAGLGAGLSMYTYYGTRLLPYLLLIFFAYLALCHFKLFKARLAGIALMTVGFIVGFGPLFAHFLRNPQMWAGRGLNSLNIPPTLPGTWQDLVSIFATLAPLLRLNFLSLSVVPSADHVYWGTFMQRAEVVLLAIGMGAMVWRWRQPGAFLVMLWGLGVLFIGGTLVDAGHIPAFVHWAPAFPAFLILLAAGPALWLRSLQPSGQQEYRLGIALVSTGVALLAISNIYYYFITYPSQAPPSFEAAQGRLLESLGPNRRVLFVGNSWQPFYKTIGEMFAPDVDASDLLNPSRSLPLIPDGRDLIFVFNEDEVQYLPAVQAFYPGGTAGAIQTPGGLIGLTYTVLSAEIEKSHGIRLELESADGARWNGIVGQVGNLPADMSVTYPLTATWAGAFFVASDKPVRLGFEADRDVRPNLRVIGTPVTPGSQLQLDAGWVPFSVRVSLSTPVQLGLLLQEGDHAAQEIGTRQLWPLPEGAGLAVTHSGIEPAHRIDPFVGASMFGGSDNIDPAILGRDPNFLPMVSHGGSDLIRWEGEVYADGGIYKMELRTDANAHLVIDGMQTISICADPDAPTNGFVPGGYIAIRGGYQPVVQQVELSGGWHHVHLDLEAAGRTNGLEWAWTRPDGTREIIPPSRLRHSPGAWPDSPQRHGCTR